MKRLQVTSLDQPKRQWRGSFGGEQMHKGGSGEKSWPIENQRHGGVLVTSSGGGKVQIGKGDRRELFEG